MKNDKKSVNVLYFVLLAVYLVASIFVVRIARSEGVVFVLGGEMPVASFTGVLSSITNLIVIFLVILYGKVGFYTSLAILLLQFPMMIRNIIFGHNFVGIPGFFTNFFTIIAILIIYNRNKQIEKYQRSEFMILTDQKNAMSRLFEQTATALVNAIDAKDNYSHGHSIRVAEYSEMMAKMLGKSKDECRKIYYAGLLHDVGKIGIHDNIINKKGKLTVEEYDTIKEHPVKGNQILSSIGEYPFLCIGAHYHHERYDGTGYPDGLKGDDIPEIARIISVADAYDAMSSNRSYRQVIPQQLVREEIVKGAGTQFDPKITKLMQYLIDADTEYNMREKVPAKELAGRNELSFDEYRSDISDGMLLTETIARIHVKVSKSHDMGVTSRGPSLIIFDSLDCRVHDDEETAKRLCVYEYAEIWLEGEVENKGARNIETTFTPNEDYRPDGTGSEDEKGYDIIAVKVKDHAQISIRTSAGIKKIIIAMPDTSRYAYLSLTGEHCRISDVFISRDGSPVADDYIKRIADEIVYDEGPEGDIPNIQIDGYRAAATEGIPLGDDLVFNFHTMSLPTARLIWHCPYLVVYSSDDGKISGDNYREYALVRIDGENWESRGISENRLVVNFSDSFEGWDAWKRDNKKGYDCQIRVIKEGSIITTRTQNLGLNLKNITTVTDGTKNFYVSLTGDQCVLTNIRIQTT